MKICKSCSAEYDDSAVFCQYCGKKLFDIAAVTTDTVINETVKVPSKKTGFKKFVASIAVILFIILAVVVAFSELKIAKAKQLYAQGEYTAAGREVHNIPTLGREPLIRINVARFAGGEYQSYLITKRIRLSSNGNIYDDAYQDAFWELSFGLYLNQKWIQNTENGIELDEYQKFINLYYSELQTMFSMSKSDADSLTSSFSNAADVSDMKTLANNWLDTNFFNKESDKIVPPTKSDAKQAAKMHVLEDALFYLRLASAAYEAERLKNIEVGTIELTDEDDRYYYVTVYGSADGYDKYGDYCGHYKFEAVVEVRKSDGIVGHSTVHAD